MADVYLVSASYWGEVCEEARHSASRAEYMLRQIHRYDRAGSQLMRLPRAELFAGLFILGCANGLAARVIHTIDVHGWADAIFNTFDISVIVLAACFLGISFILHDQFSRA